MKAIKGVLRALVLSAIFAMLIFSAQALGSTQPTPEGLQALHLTECQLPCWLGIVSGQTKFEDAIRDVTLVYSSDILSQDSGDNLEDIYFLIKGIAALGVKNEIINSLGFDDAPLINEKITLGDFANLAGVPLCVMTAPDKHTSLIYSSRETSVVVAGQYNLESRWRNPIAFIAVFPYSIECPRKN